MSESAPRNGELSLVMALRLVCLDITFADLFEILTFSGFWKLARKYYRDGLMEIVRSVSKRAFVKSLQQLIPEITEDDLLPARSGVRAQALVPDGKLDFLIVKGQNSIHICNAPSAAATGSLEIGRFIANQLPNMTLARMRASQLQAWQIDRPASLAVLTTVFNYSK